MVPFAALLILLLKSCSAFLSPAASPGPLRVCGWCRPGRSAGNFVFVAAAKSAPPENEKASGQSACGAGPKLPCEGQSGVSAVLANYPRSSYSKTNVKPPNCQQNEQEGEVTFDSKALMRLLQECDAPEPKTTEGTSQCKDGRTEPESQLSRHPEAQPKAHERVTGLLSANPSARWLCAGRVSGAHGLRGFLKIEPATFAKTERFCTPGEST